MPPAGAAAWLPLSLSSYSSLAASWKTPPPPPPSPPAARCLAKRGAVRVRGPRRTSTHLHFFAFTTPPSPRFVVLPNQRARCMQRGELVHEIDLARNEKFNSLLVSCGFSFTVFCFISYLEFRESQTITKVPTSPVALAPLNALLLFYFYEARDVFSSDRRFAARSAVRTIISSRLL